MEVEMQPTVENTRGSWTFEDVDNLDVADWWRYQIVDGALVVSPSANFGHEVVSAQVRASLQNDLPPELVVVGPMGVSMKPSFLVPDLLVAPRDLPRQASNLSPADVLLVVEVVSPSSVTMDRLVKPAKYASAGIVAYWRVETEPVSLTAYALRAGVYAEVGSWSAGEVAELTEPFPVRIELTTLG